MKALFTLQIIFSLALTLAKAQEEPLNQWYIAPPNFSRETLDLFLEYRISDYVPYESIKWRLYDGRECRDGATDITSNNFLTTTESAAGDFDGRGNGTAYRNITLGFEFDPATIRDSPIFSEVALQAYLNFCVQISAYLGDHRLTGSIELFTRQTFLSVEINQEGGFQENVTVTPEEVGEVGDEEAFGLIGYLCDENNTEILEADAIWAGMTTKVCVTPNDEARAAGIYMRAIDSFVWSRQNIAQTAIYTHQQAAQLTEIDCEPAMLVCSFKTLLKSAFYYTEGTVDGAGVGWLQYGTSYNATGRRVQIVPSPGLNQTLQDADEYGVGTPGWAGSGIFSITQPVQRLYDVVGYLCDENNLEIDPLAYPLRQGGIARVCVRPNNFALAWDIKMRSIESFNWTRSETELYQVALSPNVTAEEGTTMVSCTPGEVMCIFETELMDDFFQTRGAIQGSGVAWLEFDGVEQARRTMIRIESPSSRTLQSGSDLGVELFPVMEPGFAGASKFSLFVYTLPPRNELERYTCRAYECDEDLVEFVSGSVRKQGSKMRICVAPSEVAKDAGASMWAIEWWTWSQGNLTQASVERQGIEAKDGRTLLTCDRGSSICVFETRLIDDFFWRQTNGLDGDGNCWLTFGGDSFQARIESSDEAEDFVPQQSNIDPVADPLYAGSSDIFLKFVVGGNWLPPVFVCPEEEHDLQVWWDNEDEDRKSLYTAAVVLFGLSVCCMLCCCLFVHVRRRKEYVEHQQDNNVILNIGMDKTETIQSVHNQHHHQSMWQMLRSQLHPQQEDVETGKQRRAVSLKYNGEEPREDDVYFSDPHHPGTRACRNLVRRYIKQNPEATYGPEAFKTVKKQLGREIFFLFLEDEDDDYSGWREAEKREIVSSVGEIWRHEKSRKELQESNK